jgi:hypothetical protein
MSFGIGVACAMVTVVLLMSVFEMSYLASLALGALVGTIVKGVLDVVKDTRPNAE